MIASGFQRRSVVKASKVEVFFFYLLKFFGTDKPASSVHSSSQQRSRVGMEWIPVREREERKMTEWKAKEL
jgi:hypothetical protein